MKLAAISAIAALVLAAPAVGLWDYPHGGHHGSEQPAPAAPIELQTRHGDRQASLQRDPAADARRLAVCIGLREHYVVDSRAVKASAREHCLHDGRAQLLDRYGAQGTAERTHGGADREDDRGSSHGSP